VARLWETKCPAGMPPDLSSMLILLCCWHLLKHKNKIVFRHT
jgi:hypothetical protein